MSFSFSVATATPPPPVSILDRLDDSDLRFEEEDEVGDAWPARCLHLYRPGVSTRGVEVCHQRGAVTVRLLACSAPEDHELGLRFVRATAELAGARVQPQDAEEIAVADLDGRYGAEWAARQVRSAARVVAHAARERGLVTIRGPVREFHVGKRLLGELEPEVGTQNADKVLAERLLGAIRRTQYVDPERYYEAGAIEVEAGGGRGGLQMAVWTPSSIGHLFTPVDYIFLMAKEQDGGEVLVVPFDAVPEIAADRCAFLDEDQLLVEPVGERDWPALSERAERYRIELP